MPLIQVYDDSLLLAEILHWRLNYRREHIARLAEIREPPAPYNLKSLRNNHLLAVQVASGQDGFGEEIS